MSKPKHAPGPWRYVFEADGTAVYSADKKLVCVGVMPTIGVGDVDANARLIEAAPDLLAACQFVLDNAGGPPADMLSRIRAAVKKAT